jgi:CheY-like chemotaxis protein
MNSAIEPRYHAVMLIDDNEIDNIINTKMLEHSNFAKVIYTHNSAQGAVDFLKNIAKIADATPNIVPRYIFLDLDMPMMDGFQFLEEFQKLDSKLTSNISIVMLTASVNNKDKEKAGSFNHFVKYLNKPLKAEELKAL